MEKNYSLMDLFKSLLVFILLTPQIGLGQSLAKPYICPPCNLPCDTLHFDGPGTCPHCQMTLVSLDRVHQENQLQVNEVYLKEGSSFFMIEGGKGTRKTPSGFITTCLQAIMLSLPY